jgi:glyoxylase-like metal-dependent hydrolase (beta-lactamase superfamily II)
VIRSIFLLVGLLLLIGCADVASDTSNDQQQPFEVVKLRDGVFAVIANEARDAMANSGIVDLGGDKILVFDTSLTPEVGALIKETAEDLIEGQVFIVVNSNFESAHVRGNQAFEDVIILGTTRIQEGITESEPARLESEKQDVPRLLEETRARLADAADDRERDDLELELSRLETLDSSTGDVIPTTSTLIWDTKINFNGAKRSAKIVPFGHAKTPSDAALYLVADSLLFASDLVIGDRHPDMHGSDLTGWRAALDSLALLPVHEVIPGHGPITDKSSIDETRAYLDLVEETARAVKNGDLDLEAVEPTGSFESLRRSDRFKPNVEAVVSRLGL